MSVNKAIVMGNLGADPLIRALPSGGNVVNFSIATTERFTDRAGAKQKRTEWHRVVAFGRLAEVCGEVSEQRPASLCRRRLSTRIRSQGRSGKRLQYSNRRAPDSLPWPTQQCNRLRDFD